MEILQIDETELEDSEVIMETKDNDVIKKVYWEVYLDNQLVDTVLYDSQLTDKQVRCRLITIDGYPSDITVSLLEVA
jgi:hypothetical protein